MRRVLAVLAALACPGAGQALDLALPGNAILAREVTQTAESYNLPVGPYENGRMETLQVEGALVQQAWRLEAQAITTLQMFEPLRSQLTEAGYEILLDCSGRDCGGFDFRFNTRVLPAPDMFVDLFDYRFLSARGVNGAAHYVSVLVSRAGTTGYIQVIHVAAGGLEDIRVAADPAREIVPEATGQPPVARALLEQGHVILGDLKFESGSSELGQGPFETLQALADFLKADGARRVALVGHTDTVGGLEPNIALSKRRAQSVRERLIGAYDVPGTQLDAEGMGYLAPVAPNITGAGREANRRVEAVLLNSDG